MKKHIFTTAPHGAQELSWVGKSTAGDTFGNALFRLSETLLNDGSSITFTGEELDSLAEQWLQFRAKNKRKSK